MILACTCGKKFKIPPEKAAKLRPGSHFKCTGCGHDIPIPHDDSADEPPTVIMAPPSAPAPAPRPAAAPTAAPPSAPAAAPPAPPTPAAVPSPSLPAAADMVLQARIQELEDLLDMERKMFSEELDHLKEEVRLLQAQREEEAKATAEAALAPPNNRVEELETRVRELEAARDEAAKQAPNGCGDVEELLRCAAALVERMEQLSVPVAALRLSIERSTNDTKGTNDMEDTRDTKDPNGTKEIKDTKGMNESRGESGAESGAGPGEPLLAPQPAAPPPG